MRRFAPFVLPVVLPVLLVAVACGGNDEVKPKAATIDDITVSGPVSAKPKIEFKAPLSFSKTAGETVVEGPGKGPAVRPSSVVTVEYVGEDARDGAQFASSWDSGKPATFALTEVIAGFSKGLQGARAGDRVKVAVASKDGFDPTGNGGAILKGDSLVLVIDLHEVANPLTEAEGKPAQVPATLPRLVLDKDGHPKRFTSTPQTAKKPTKLGVYPTIVGAGDPVKAGQTIVVEYVGQIYPDGKVFDESWSRDEPVSLSIGTGNVIKGWDQGLVGQRVGSRVILVISSELGYGKKGSGATVPPNSDLIFAVDILQAY